MIPDIHTVPADWGIRPALFTIGGHPVVSYAFFVTLGLIVAVVLYRLNTRGKSVGNNALYIAVAAAVGGILGSKLPIWVAYFREIFLEGQLQLLWSGRTIVGGIIGGVAAVYLTKKRLNITERLGNYLVPSLCIGIFFGRIGCFLAGCCYGTPTSLPWGVDFGDAVLRNPTQLYEAALVLGLFVYAQVNKDKFEPGELFRGFMIVYFSWRFLAEFMRVNPVAALGLTYYQFASLAVVFHYVFRNAFRSLVRSAT
ncbi:MAG: prolipoprotein diacylglyceryl transferase [Coriobacteriia bacterium]